MNKYKIHSKDIKPDEEYDYGYQLGFDGYNLPERHLLIPGIGRGYRAGQKEKLLIDLLKGKIKDD